MSDSQAEDKNIVNPPSKRLVPFDLRLRTPRACRATLANLTRAYSRGEIESTTFKTLIYALSHLIAMFKYESDLEIMERIENLERYINGGNPHE